MSKLVEEIKLLITNEFRDTINDDINNLISFWQWDHVKDKLTEGEIRIPEISDEDIASQTSMWSSLAKLAVNLWYDYDFFKQFKFKGQFDGQEYAEVLRTIGYVVEDDMWVNRSKPLLEDVHTVMLTYFVHLAVRIKKDHDEEIVLIRENDRLQRLQSCTLNPLDVDRSCSCDSGVDIVNESNIGAEGHPEVSNSPVITVEAWDCRSCTFKNRSNKHICEVCSNHRQSGYLTTWLCVHCSRPNLFDTYICMSCHKFGPFFRKWICEKCSFINNELEERCTVCDNINQNLRNCSGCKKRMIKIGDSSFCSNCLVPLRRPSQDKLNHCVKCKRTLSLGATGICDKCEKVTYYCSNQWCGAINKKTSKHCQKCKLKKNSVITEYDCVDVHNGIFYTKMWQCTFCHKFNSKTKCTCMNQQNSSHMKKCPWCNWVNAATLRNCDKCRQKLP